MSRPSKRGEVLRAAEVVFADKGYDRATMRNVAEAANVGLPLVVYHFGTKLNLYRSVFEDFQHWNDSRRKALASVDLQDENALEQIVEAFLLVARHSETDPSIRNYLRLVLREASDPHAHERGIIDDLFDPMARDFITALEAALPDKPKGFHRWAYLFAVGAYTSTNFSERERSLAAPEEPKGDRLQYLHNFICAGMRYG